MNYRSYRSLHKTRSVYTLTGNRMFDFSKLKAFTDVKLDLTQLMRYDIVRIESIVGKGENAGTGNQHFLVVLECFHKPLSSGWLNTGM